MENRSETSITFVVPALNEESVVGLVLEKLLAVCRGHLDRFEVIAIDDGSTDATGRIMDEVAAGNPAMRVIHNPVNRGIGAAYKTGLAEATGDYFMLLCGDGGLPAESLPPILAQIGRADIVVPYMSNLRRIKTTFRYVLSRTYTGLLNTIFGLSLNYYNGLPLHRTGLLRTLEIESDGFGFQGEILIKLIKSGHSFVQVPVLGTAGTDKSSALRLSSIIDMAKTFFRLILDVRRYLRGPRVASGKGRLTCDRVK